NGFYHVPAQRYRKLTGTYGHPKMICRLILRYVDGDTESIVSNSTWKTAPGPVTFTSIFGGEDYDARLEKKGWNRTGFNDISWKLAVVTDGPPVLNATITEPLKVMQVFVPQKITEPKPEIYVFDFGQNFSRIPAFSVEGRSGEKFRLIPGEILDSSGLVNQQPSGKPAYFNYILKGNGPESWQPQFTYYGFRYIQVEGAVAKGKENPGHLPVINEMKGLHTRHSAQTSGSFSCSNVLFNNIFKLIDWSVRSNLASVLTDCPHREKLGWLEVAHLLGNSVRYNYNIASLYRKIIDDMKSSQEKTGFVPNIAPEWVQFETDFRDSPEWGSSSVILPYDLYQWYGDKQVLTDSYDMMKRYVDYLGSKANDHIVSHGLGDWFDIGPNGSGSGYSVSTPQGITGTAIYYHDLQIVSKVASILGHTTDAHKYQQIAEEVKIAFNGKFFNSNTKQYGTASQTANAMAVFMGLVRAEDKATVVANIKKDIRNRGNRLTSGEVGYKHLLAVLEKEGESQLIYDMNSRSDVPGYGYQIAHGATTLMEDWQAIKTLGNNHCMLGHLLGWLYSGLGGIRQQDSSLAFKKIIISPEVVGDITSVNAQYRSPYGTIISKWEKDANNFRLYVEIPVNTDAAIYLPATEQSEIYINGSKVSTTEIEQCGKGKVIVKLGSGGYSLRVTDLSR
ncbi:MAG TPA: family 78 glycoside hydrolase catalytic domain, partial [Flavitalea sp.]|nr:family 78 glycoside hydrolase catalytic domain [Flavitalea sp.]